MRIVVRNITADSPGRQNEIGKTFNSRCDIDGVVFNIERTVTKDLVTVKTEMEGLPKEVIDRCIKRALHDSFVADLFRENGLTMERLIQIFDKNRNIVPDVFAQKMVDFIKLYWESMEKVSEAFIAEYSRLGVYVFEDIMLSPRLQAQIRKEFSKKYLELSGSENTISIDDLTAIVDRNDDQYIMIILQSICLEYLINTRKDK